MMPVGRYVSDSSVLIVWPFGCGHSVYRMCPDCLALNAYERYGDKSGACRTCNGWGCVA